VSAAAFNRRDVLAALAARAEAFDIVVVGGGATGLGIAVDAGSRGYSVCLLEQADFAKGTSSRSTKLVHGGVRYLQQGNISLVTEALRERGRLRANAPHLVHDLPFIVPTYDWWESPFYGIGMKVYDLLAGKYGFGRSKVLGKEQTRHALPNVSTEGLRGGVLYYDGQFDDARLAVTLARTAADQGGLVLNGARVDAILKDERGHAAGVRFIDEESGRSHDLAARCVINATGPFVDAVRRMDDAAAKPMIRPSQGVHIVLDRSFLGADHAIMVPHTKDGRVMFAIPWHHVVVVGTTDTEIDSTPLEPAPLEHEVGFILETAAPYLQHDPTREDIRSVFTGIRPLVASTDAGNTSAVSRDHTLHISDSGVLTVAGGKWTTYRNMAEDAVDQAADLAGLDERECVTRRLPLRGASEPGDLSDPLQVYGTDRGEIEQIEHADPSLAEPLHPSLPIRKSQVVHAARFEMARTVDDVLARRTRAILFDAAAAAQAAPVVADLLAAELGRDDAWRAAQLADFARIVAVHTP